MLLGAVAALLGVALGAFGAHGLRGRLSPDMLAVFQTGVRYHMYHALALLITALALARFDGWLIRTAGWLFIAGIVLFSGSLYALALSPASRCSARSRRSAAWRFSPAGPASSSRRSDRAAVDHHAGNTKTRRRTKNQATESPMHSSVDSCLRGLSCLCRRGPGSDMIPRHRRHRDRRRRARRAVRPRVWPGRAERQQGVDRGRAAVRRRRLVAAADVKTRLRRARRQPDDGDGVLLIDSREHRTQGQNREAARARLIALLQHAARRPKTRRPTTAEEGGEREAARVQETARRSEIAARPAPREAMIDGVQRRQLSSRRRHGVRRGRVGRHPEGVVSGAGGRRPAPHLRDHHPGRDPPAERPDARVAAHAARRRAVPEDDGRHLSRRRRRALGDDREPTRTSRTCSAREWDDGRGAGARR